MNIIFKLALKLIQEYSREIFIVLLDDYNALISCVNYS